MAKFTEGIHLQVTPEMMEQAENSGYSAKAEYFRSMIAAGESNIAALDPRTQDRDSGDMPESDSVEEVAQALADTVILNQLSEDPQTIDEVLETPTNQFQTVLATRLAEMANNESSPVEQDPLSQEYTLNVEE